MTYSPTREPSREREHKGEQAGLIEVHTSRPCFNPICIWLYATTTHLSPTFHSHVGTARNTEDIHVTRKRRSHNDPCKMHHGNKKYCCFHTYIQCSRYRLGFYNWKMSPFTCRYGTVDVARNISDQLNWISRALLKWPELNDRYALILYIYSAMLCTYKRTI